MDTIIIHEKQIPKIKEWAEQHKGGNFYDFPFEQVYIVIETDKKLFRIKVMFEIVDENNITLKIYDNNDNSLLVHTKLNLRDNKVSIDVVKRYSKLYSDYYLKQTSIYFTLLVLEIFQYMTHVEEHVIKETTVYHTKKKSKTKKGKKRSKPRYIKVTHTVYRIDTNAKTTKRKYERHTNAWRVRGHWRYYKKSGKRVWIEPHIRGQGEPDPKIYRI